MSRIMSDEPRTATPAEIEETHPIRAHVALATVCLLWAGMIAGISFLEAPVKFTAPSLTLPVGLDVGRQVFAAFNKVEIAWALATLGLQWIVKPPRRILWCLAAAWLAIALQAAWLRPALDARVTLILAGGTPPAAPYHLVYIALEAVKFLALCAAGTGLIAAAAGRTLRAGEDYQHEDDLAAQSPDIRHHLNG